MEGQDDFAMMEQVVRRRFGHDEDFGGMPDLVLIDGGKGQLSSALAAMKAAGVDFLPVISLAKERVRGGETVFHERIFLPGRKNPVVLPPHDPALLLLMRVRDEAHRFAIAHHRIRRDRAMTTSLLDELPGIGPSRKRALLKHFGSPDAVAGASREQLESVPGIPGKVAREVYAQLHKTGR